MATTLPPARRTTSYEELIVDILVTKSLVFSVVGLESVGLGWIHRLTEHGFPTIGVPRAFMPTSLPSTDGHGLLHLSADHGEVSGGDVVLHCAPPRADDFEALVPHLRRGQVLFYPSALAMSHELKERLVATAGQWGLAVGVDFFIFHGSIAPGKATDFSEVSGVTEVCDRVGRAIHEKILQRLLAR